MALNRLVVVLEDQLDPAAPWRDAIPSGPFDPRTDLLWMAEPAAAFRAAGAHKQRIAVILGAMRSYRNARTAEGVPVHYHSIEIDAHGALPTVPTDRPIFDVLAEDLRSLAPAEVVAVTPGSVDAHQRLREAAAAAAIPYTEIEDTHFYDTSDGFAEFMAGRSTPLLEHYYRRLRRHTGILMNADGSPEGGEWNFDKANRKSFGAGGPGITPAPPRYPDGPLRREVAELVERAFATHPGTIDLSLLPLTPEEAEEHLTEFLANRLAWFGDYQDAMWSSADFLYHSRLSTALNLKLIDPHRVVDAAVEAYRRSRGTGAEVPINAVEGFVRQILGWREYVRGIYRHYMPEYAGRNALNAGEALPSFFWDGKTEMTCLRDTMRTILSHGYAHHIQRLMVMGLFSMIYGADPAEFNAWHTAMYTDAFDWVSTPNAIGMSQFADGGIVGTKPYAASGNYINRMSNYCSSCPFDPGVAAGDNACPVTTLYWTFLRRHRGRFSDNRRMLFQMKNLDRKTHDQLEAIAARERQIRRRAAEGTL